MAPSRCEIWPRSRLHEMKERKLCSCLCLETPQCVPEGVEELWWPLVRVYVSHQRCLVVYQCMMRVVSVCPCRLPNASLFCVTLSLGCIPYSASFSKVCTLQSEKVQQYLEIAPAWRDEDAGLGIPLLTLAGTMRVSQCAAP